VRQSEIAQIVAAVLSASRCCPLRRVPGRALPSGGRLWSISVFLASPCYAPYSILGFASRQDGPPPSFLGCAYVMIF